MSFIKERTLEIPKGEAMSLVEVLAGLSGTDPDLDVKDGRTVTFENVRGAIRIRVRDNTDAGIEKDPGK